MTTTFTATSKLYHTNDNDDNVTIDSAEYRKGRISSRKKPNTTVLPRSSGPINNPERNDILSGRGGRVNIHLGNVRFRDVVLNYKKQYLDVRTTRQEKANIAADIVAYMRSQGGRFLKQDETGTYDWYEIGDKQAIRKTAQALREDAPEIRCNVQDANKFPKEEGNLISSNPNDVSSYFQSSLEITQPEAEKSTIQIPTDQNDNMISNSFRNSFTEMFGNRFYRPSLTKRSGDDNNEMLSSRISSIGSISEFTLRTKDSLEMKNNNESTGKARKGFKNAKFEAVDQMNHVRDDYQHEYINTSNNNEPSERNSPTRNSIRGEFVIPNHDHEYRESLRMSAITMPDLDLDDFTEEDYESDGDFDWTLSMNDNDNKTIFEKENEIDSNWYEGENRQTTTNNQRMPMVHHRNSLCRKGDDGKNKNTISRSHSETSVKLLTSIASAMAMSVDSHEIASVHSSIKSVSNSVMTSLSMAFSTVEV